MNIENYGKSIIMSNAFLITQIDELETIIIALNAAIVALLSGDHISYELDTGQTRQRVTRLELPELRITRNDMLVEYQSLCALAGLSRSVVTVRPGF